MRILTHDIGAEGEKGMIRWSTVMMVCVCV